jgi:hypothetical protein
MVRYLRFAGAVLLALSLASILSDGLPWGP